MIANEKSIGMIAAGGGSGTSVSSTAANALIRGYERLRRNKELTKAELLIIASMLGKNSHLILVQLYCI